jgi:hypothetical protein
MTIIKLAIGSIFVGLVVLGVKSLAYWMTGSVALLSDALEGTVNVATAFAALIAIHIATRPADANHPYGHHKAELFSAVLEGVEPPHLNWSTVMFRRRRTRNGEQAAQARGNSSEAAAG